MTATIDRRTAMVSLAALTAGCAASSPSSSVKQRETMRRAAEAAGFQGVLLIGQGTRVDAIDAFGWADVEARVPLSTDTSFETGSISKWIAAMVVMTLVDDGQLALDAPIARYLPDYRADHAAVLTLLHLMSHSSGVPNDVITALRAGGGMLDTGDDLPAAVRRYASGDLRFAPGTQWDYSHSNWLIVKAIVERVSGRPYETLVDQVLVKPLGLAHSGMFSGDSSRIAGMAVGYTTAIGNGPPPPRRGGPVPVVLAMAGGYRSSAADLLRLMHGVLDGPVLSPASRETLMRVVRPAQHYALGGRTRLRTIAGAERPCAWEDGSNGAFRAVARRVLADGRSVVALNHTSFDHAKLGELCDVLIEAAYA